MSREKVGKALVAGLFGVVLLPVAALAQSAISGLVRDTSGGVLPGVTVEAASPALIEKVRTVVTDEQGRYTIVDLRPGIYKVTFTLPGFSTLVRDGLDLPSEFTATVNADLSVGALEETVTVSGDSPIVDVQNIEKTTVLKRELLDAVPTARTFAAVGSLAVGVRVNSQNVGGARVAGQQRILIHGLTSVDNTIAVDGMKMNTLYLDGDTQPNHNDGMSQEITVQTGSPSAEVSGGGIFLNLIPREGGNIFSGSSFIGYTDSSFQGDNLTPDLRALGLVTADAVEYIYDLNPSLGGPIKRNRLWFFGSVRHIGNANHVPNSFYPDGRPGLYDQNQQNFTTRLTWQATGRNKVTTYVDRALKYVGHNFSTGTDVEKAAAHWTTPLYYTGAVKWTSTITNRFLLEAGFGAVGNGINMLYQPGVMKTRYTPEWYANASRADIVLNTRTTAAPPANAHYPYGYLVTSALSYVTGSHAFKTGVQWRYGHELRTTESNADLVQQYRNGVPDSVVVYSTPSRATFRLNADLGVYVQDSWTINRLTLGPGVRLEYFNALIEPWEVEPGRFVGFRSTPKVPDLPNWFDVAPRFGAAYDLTGDARTALKAGINKYHAQQTTGFPQRYSALNLQSDTRNWSDCDLIPGTSTCSGRVLPTNRDDIAQDNEIGPSNNARFGQSPARQPHPDIKRGYTVEYMAGVDHQLLPGVAVGVAWYRRNWYNRERQVNLLVDPKADYTAFETPNPLTGEPITIYNLNRNKQGLIDLVDMTSTDRSKNRMTYHSVELSFTLRLPNGGSVFGGWSGGRTIEVACEGANPNTWRNCDQSLFDIPFLHDFKLVGTYPLPLGLQLGAVWQSYAGASTAVNWALPASAFPGGQRTQSVTVNLIEPGSRYLKRWNQVDLTLKKNFRVKRVHFDAALDLFNSLNSNVVLSVNQNFGPTLGAPQQILQPRLLRVSTQMKF